jgi:hypothetical protein
MAIEFASQDRTIGQVDERFSNIGGLYQQAKSSRLARPFGPVARDHARKIEETKKHEQEAEAAIRKVKLEGLLKKPVTDPSGPRRTKAGKRFDLSEKYRQAGNVQEAQKQERLASNTGREEYLRYLAGKVVRKLRDPVRRWDSE